MSQLKRPAPPQAPQHGRWACLSPDLVTLVATLVGWRDLPTLLALAPRIGLVERGAGEGALRRREDRDLGALAEVPLAMVATAKERHEAGGLWATPGLIDCHTHLVYAGNRAEEYEQRLKGASYAEINAEDDAVREAMIVKAGGRRTVPQIFIGETHVGGCDDLYALDKAGKLDALLAD